MKINDYFPVIEVNEGFTLFPIKYYYSLKEFEEKMLERIKTSKHDYFYFAIIVFGEIVYWMDITLKENMCNYFDSRMGSGERKLTTFEDIFYIIRKEFHKYENR